MDRTDTRRRFGSVSMPAPVKGDGVPVRAEGRVSEGVRTRAIRKLRDRGPWQVNTVEE